jgi:hypothetical protein
MADPNKFKSVSVPIKTYKMLEFLGKGKFVDANLTISKTIEVLATKEAKNTVTKRNKDFCQINYKPGSVI